MGFLGLLSLLLLGAWLYVWRRLVVSSRLPKFWQSVVTVILALALAVQIVSPFLFRKLIRGGHRTGSFYLSLSYGFLGFMALLFFFALIKDLVYLLTQKLASKNSDLGSDSNAGRRLFLMRSLNLAAIGLAAGGTVKGIETAHEGPRIKEVTVPVAGLHPDLDGLKIVQISDLHAGDSIGHEQVRHVVTMANALDADIAVLTGDIADGLVSRLEEQTNPLADLKGRLGKFYVTGNHEYYWDVDDWIERAKELGFTYLYNENRVVKVKSARLHIGGVPDYMCARIRPDHESNPVMSMKNGDNANERGASAVDYKILLAHQPKSCFEAFKAGYDLQLSGHTHNGQFFPASLVIRFFHPYVKGLNLHENKMWVYVNVGTGYWGPAQRLGVPAEITLLRLQRV